MALLRMGPAVFSGLGIHTPHVDAKAGVAVLLGHEKWVGSPGAGAKFGDVNSIVLLDALMEQFLLVMG